MNETTVALIALVVSIPVSIAVAWITSVEASRRERIGSVQLRRHDRRWECYERFCKEIIAPYINPDTQFDDAASVREIRRRSLELFTVMTLLMSDETMLVLREWGDIADEVTYGQGRDRLLEASVSLTHQFRRDLGYDRKGDLPGLERVFGTRVASRGATTTDR